MERKTYTYRVTIVGIYPAQLDSFWHRVEPLLKEAEIYSPDGLTTQELRKWIETSDAQLWGVFQGKLLAAVVTRIVCYPHLKSLQVTSLSGLAAGALGNLPQFHWPGAGLLWARSFSDDLLR